MYEAQQSIIKQRRRHIPSQLTTHPSVSTTDRTTKIPQNNYTHISYRNLISEQLKKQTNRIVGFHFDFEVATLERLHEDLHLLCFLKFTSNFYCSAEFDRRNVEKKGTANPTVQVKNLFHFFSILVDLFKGKP